uniref:Pseudouridine kinase n=1 Tax=Anthurium amnicola TaxID=1678845 RepID=A0A1D1XK61_9ARAE
MEACAQRRLQSILRHVLPRDMVADDLHPNLLYARESSSECSAPVIVGGMVLDIHAKPFTLAKPGTTTPGKIKFIRGGVGRNVAEAMAKLGSNPFLISAVGVDLAGDLLLEYWNFIRLSTDGILKCPSISTPVVSNIFDMSGESAAAVASVEAVENFVTPDWIRRFHSHISVAPVLMLDANLHPFALEAACQMAAESGIPVWFEPVSVTKSKRIASVVKYVTFTSPNEAELISMAEALSSGDDQYSYKRIGNIVERQSVENLLQNLKPAICLLLEKGIKLVVVTLGADGVFLCSRERSELMKSYLKDAGSSSSGRQLYKIVNEIIPSKQFICSINFEHGKNHSYIWHLPAIPTSVVSLTGAGDCLVGGTLASICAGLNVMQSIAVGISAAKAAVETESNVPYQYHLTTIADEVKQIFSAAKLYLLDG